MIFVRLPDWQALLSAEIARALRRRFEWGVNDCALFAADAILAMTGEDPAEGWRGRYTTARGARRILHRAGYGSQVAVAARLFARVPPASARVGDIAVLARPEGLTLGVVAGEMIAAPGPDGLAFAPRGEALEAYLVPFAGETD